MFSSLKVRPCRGINSIKARFSGVFFIPNTCNKLSIGYSDVQVIVSEDGLLCTVLSIPSTIFESGVTIVSRSIYVCKLETILLYISISQTHSYLFSLLSVNHILIQNVNTLCQWYR